MEIIKTEIPDVLIIKPDVFEDKRGYFFESYNKAAFLKLGLDIEFLQDNQSLSEKGVLRGLHFQKPPFAQGKLVRVIKGSVIDVAVDIRKNSPSYGKYVITTLTEKNKWMFYMPEGFAHGFLTLEDNTVFAYKCTQLYNKNAEDVIRWNDPSLNIPWEIVKPILSERDANAQLFQNFVSPF